MQVTAEQLLVATAAAAALSSIARGAQTLRGTLAIAGLAMLVWGIVRHHPGPAIAGGSLLFVNLGRFVLQMSAGRGARALTAEEEALRAHGFADVPGVALRQLLDQGLWINAKAGEVLLHEGVVVGHLFYLSEGEVSITAEGRPIATSGPGHFFGELDVLSHTPGIATIALTSAGRFWCISAEALDRFLAANPHYRPALELALASELREKLRERSRQIARAAIATR